MICDAKGRPLDFALLPGQTAELKAASALLAGLRQRPDQVVCDRAYSSADWRNQIRALGAEPVVPANPTHPAVTYDPHAYRRRHRVENLWAKLKEWRAIATRHEKTAASYLANLHIASALLWLSNGP